MTNSTDDTGFSGEQKRYLEGYMSGLTVGRAVQSLTANRADSKGAGEPTGPDAIHIKAQDRVLESGGKLSDPEKFKRELNPLDAYAQLEQQARKNEAPKPADNFRWRFFGLFYVAPTQSFYMCRLRIPNGMLTHWQMAGLADLAEKFGGGYAHVTTRANIQIREIEPKNAVHMLEEIELLGLCARGSGADNIRNVTGTPTAGIDPQELIDTRTYARAWHFHILNERALYGLPRKFNVAFDGAGLVPVLEDTNDIGFQAVVVKDGFGAEPGVRFRVMLGGITGHCDFARETGVIVKPEETTQVADAIVRVFIENGNRSDRNKARLKYVLDDWGIDKYIAAVEDNLGRRLTKVPPEALEERPAFDRFAHIGVHKQKQEGLNWIGVAMPVGRLTVAQMRGLADVARDFGDGDLRLTVWQNLLISGVADGSVSAAQAAIAALGLSTKATSIRSGLVACTGNIGCRFAASDTKRHAEEIAQWCEARIALDTPINIHLTGCHHSCAQHYISDIGLLACKVEEEGEGDKIEQIEGYHVYIGGVFGPQATIGKEIYRDVKAQDLAPVIERILRGYVANREGNGETFLVFARRYEVDALKEMFEAEVVA